VGTGGAAASAPAGAANTAPAKPIEEPRGPCIGYLQRLHLVHVSGDRATLEDTFELGEREQAYSSSLGDGVLFATVSQSYSYGRGYPVGAVAVDGPCLGRCGGSSSAPDPAKLLVLSGFEDGKLTEGRIDVEATNDANRWWGFWGTPPVYAYGKRALLVGQGDLAIIDASSPSAPAIAERIPLIGPAQSVDIRDKSVLITLGAQGVQWIALE
jgi:hypothetical protein